MPVALDVTAPRIFLTASLPSGPGAAVAGVQIEHLLGLADLGGEVVSLVDGLASFELDGSSWWRFMRAP
jgi:hypothetical protein